MRNLQFRDIALILACMGFIIVLGAGTYEAVNLVPTWASAPPRSLYIFQGNDGADLSTFWKSIHPIVLLLFIVALIANWKTARRKPVLVALGGYVLMLVITFIYFVPELMSITRAAYTATVDAALQQRAHRWELWNIIRAVYIFLLAFVLLGGLIKAQRPVAA